MTLAEKLTDLIRRHTPAVRFASRVVLETFVPGSAALSQLLDWAFTCVQDTVEGHQEANDRIREKLEEADLPRLEEIADLLHAEFGPLLDQLAKLENLPAQAQELLITTRQTDERVRRSGERLEAIVLGNFDRIDQQLEHMLAQQGFSHEILREMLLLQREAVSTVKFFQQSLHQHGLTQAAFISLQEKHNRAVRALTDGRVEEAKNLLQDLTVALPQSSAAHQALAAAQSAGHDFAAAERSLKEAIRLAPGDAGLREMQKSLTRLTQVAGGSASTAAPVPIKPGDIIEGWKLETLLGHGGWGRVFRATKSGKIVALKVPHSHLAQQTGFQDRFKQEILALRSLPAHDHLVRHIDFGYAPGLDTWWLATELVEGGTLEQRLSLTPVLAMEEVFRIFADIASALAAAHSRDIVHRDIKPENILLKGDGRAVLVDFGLAALEGPSVTLAGAPSGHTVRFAAPEQLNGGTATRASDLYSLAASLWYALAPSKAEREARTPNRFDEEDAHALGGTLGGLLKRCLVPNDRRRLADAVEFARLLRGGEPQVTVVAPAATGKATPTPAAQVVSPHAATAPKRPHTIAGLNQDPFETPQEYADSLAGQGIFTFSLANGVTMEFMPIPAGTFTMGSPDTEQGRQPTEKQGKVTISRPFWVAKFPVTQEQYTAVTKLKNPSHFQGKPKNPVEQVTWDQADAFCECLADLVRGKLPEGYTAKLPTEAQWEYACRASDGNARYGAVLNIAWYAENSEQTTHPVGEKRANDFGLHDMLGNVWEWCLDSWNGSTVLPGGTDPVGVAGESRVIRGGSWYDPAEGCRAAYRHGYDPGGRNDNIGFRPVLTN